jgi:surface antigen
MKRKWIFASAILACVAQTAFAQVQDGAAAKKALFAADDLGVQVMKQSFLVDNQPEILASVATQQPYYGAIAVSPAEGLMSEATIAAANYHTVEAASVAALAGCDAARKGDVPCVIVALIRPKGWEARPIQLSADATAAFRKDYSGKGGALAASASTGTWAMAKGNDAQTAAVAACAAKLTGENDCTVIIAD